MKCCIVRTTSGFPSRVSSVRALRRATRSTGDAAFISQLLRKYPEHKTFSRKTCAEQVRRCPTRMISYFATSKPRLFNALNEAKLSAFVKNVDFSGAARILSSPFPLLFLWWLSYIHVLRARFASRGNFRLETFGLRPKVQLIFPEATLDLLSGLSCPLPVLHAALPFLLQARCLVETPLMPPPFWHASLLPHRRHLLRPRDFQHDTSRKRHHLLQFSEHRHRRPSLSQPRPKPAIHVAIAMHPSCCLRMLSGQTITMPPKRYSITSPKCVKAISNWKLSSISMICSKPSIPTPKPSGRGYRP